MTIDEKSDRKAVLAAVKESATALEHASEDLKADREIVLAALESGPVALKFASENLKDDREIVLAAVKKYVRALEYASEDLKDDRDIVLAAVKQDGDAIKYASNRLKQEFDHDDRKNFMNSLCKSHDADTFTKFFKDKENISFYECYWEITRHDVGWGYIAKTDLNLSDDEEGQEAFSNELFDKALISFEQKNEVTVPDAKKEELRAISWEMYIWILEGPIN
jgi:hypothetical protein